MVQQVRRPWCAWLALSMWMWMFPRSALASDVVYVRVADAACPDAAALQTALSPLLGDAVTVQVGSDRMGNSERQITVRDQGQAYVVEVDDKVREIQDPARDCAERARVAAVFIALNVNAPDNTPPAPLPPPPPPVVTLKEPSVGLALRAYGGVQLASGLPLIPGVSLGASLEARAWYVGLDVTLLSNATDDLDRPDGVTSRVAIMRVPWSLRAGHYFSLGAVSVAPALGMAIDVLQLRGEQVTRPQRETRINFGVSGALEARLALGRGWRLLAQGSLAAFPRTYRVVIDPLAPFTRMPALWFLGQFGLEWGSLSQIAQGD